MQQNDRKIKGSIGPSSKQLDLARAFAALIVCLLPLLGGTAAAQSRDDYCGGGWPQGFEARPERVRSGRYVNPTYGYSVDVPAKLSAYISAVGPERGFVIGLSDSPRAFLRVDAGYDAFYDIDAMGVHRRDLSTVRLHDAVLADQAAGAALAQVAGARYLMHVQCHADGALGIHDEVIVVRNREIYRLDLQTTASRYEQDRLQLEAMMRSWRWETVR
jgi:hypothetical protein